jgi:phage pi2 protein 07
MNSMPEAKIVFYVNKNEENWELNLKERIDKIKEEHEKRCDRDTD